MEAVVRPEKREFAKLSGQPPFLNTKKQLFDYQLEGVNWMLYCWYVVPLRTFCIVCTAPQVSVCCHLCESQS